MIEEHSVLGLITARGGSQGLPGKNLREINGRSLLARAIDAGREAASLDRLILSSDDPAIIQAALLAGCEVPFVRPEELSGPAARSIDAVRHALETLPERYDLVVLLQPTSPLRRAEDVEGAVRLCVERGAPACISVSAADKPPYWMLRRDAAGRLEPILPELAHAPRRQELPEAFVVNGAVYVARCDWVLQNDSFLSPETLGYIMPQERSLDVDEELDLVVAAAVERWIEGKTAAEEARPPARRSSR